MDGPNAAAARDRRSQGLPGRAAARGLVIGFFALAATTVLLGGRAAQIAGGATSGAPPIGRCEVTATSSHAPTHLRVGETVGITYSLLAECGDTPVNMVLVIDASGSGEMTENVLVWAEDIVSFALSVMPLARVGIVVYNDTATAQCEITAEGDVLRACIASIVTREGRRLDLGLAEAKAMFDRHRPTDPELALVTGEVAIVLMAGLPEPDCAASIEAASALRGRGEWLWSVYPCTGCTGPEDRAGVTCARRVASSRNFVTGWEEFVTLFEDSTRRLHPYSAEVSTTLPVSMSRAALFEPIPEESGRTVTWSFATPVPSALTVRYRAYANRAGSYSLGVTSAEVYVDGFGVCCAPGYGRHRLTFDPQIIHVTGSIWFPLLVNGR